MAQKPKPITEADAKQMSPESLSAHSDECELPIRRCPACYIYMNELAAKEAKVEVAEVLKP